MRFVAGGLYVAQRFLETSFIKSRRVRSFDLRTERFNHRAARGFQFSLDPAQYVDKYIFVEGIYEKRFLNNLLGRFPTGAVALDIGANVGNHAIYLSTEFSEIHCFEPNPETFRRLSENIALNDLQNVTLHRAALGDRDAVLPFRENLDGNLGNSGFVDDVTPVAKTRIIDIQVHQADTFVAGLRLDRIDFIKVDVEGFEPQVFDGLQETISTYKPVIAFEFHGQDALPGDFEKIRSHLSGYIFYELRHADAGGSAVSKMMWNWSHAGDAEFATIGEPEERTYENILAFPSQEAFLAFERRGR